MGDFQGQTVIYNDSITFPSLYIESFLPQREFLDDYIIFEGQSIYDLAVQLYGDMGQGLKELLPVLENVDQGTAIQRKVPISNIGEVFNDNDVLVATDNIIPTPIEPGEGLEYEIEFELEG